MENAKNVKKKMKKKKGNKAIAIVMSIVMLILIAVCVVIVFKTMNGDLKNTGEPKNNEISENLIVDEELYSEDTKAFTIKSSYCDLSYPEAWENVLHTEVIQDGENETIEFWAALEGKEKVHLFDVAFGDGDYEVGTLEMADGKAVAVHIISYSFTPDETWTEEETNQIYTMLEDINYILFQLEEMENYTSMY